MTSFQTFIKSHSSDKKQFWFIAGAERALVEDTLEIAKTHIFSNVDNVCMSVFFGASCTLEEILGTLERDYWEERHIVILYDCDKFEKFSELCERASKSSSSVFFIAVSNETKVNTTESHFELFKGVKGRNIICSELNADGVERWVSSRLNTTTEARNKLLELYNRDYEWLLNQIKKLEILDVELITIKEVLRICRDHGTPNFTESLLKYSKRNAILSLQGEETPKVNIPHLFNTVRKAGLLNSTIQNLGFFVRPLTEKTGISQKEIAKLKVISAYYDAQTVRRCLKTLRPFTKSSQPDRLRLLAVIAGW